MLKCASANDTHVIIVIYFSNDNSHANFGICTLLLHWDYNEKSHDIIC